MTSPGRPQPAPGERAEVAAALAEVTRTWVHVIAASTYISISPGELESDLRELAGTLTSALLAQPFDPKPGTDVGARMVAGQLVGADTLALSVEVLADGLYGIAGHTGRDAARNLLALLAAMCTGYAEAVRLRTLDQQEDMKRALLSAKQRAEQVLRATETRFREVFDSSPTGIAITDLDCRFIEVNPALEAILASRTDRLIGAGLADYLAPDEGDGVDDPLRGRLRLVRDDGEFAWVYVALSPLREGPGKPESYVMTVQDLSELQLLQGRYGHQLLHDALTGVANRLAFQSALETRLAKAEPDAEVTLYHLNLDAFSVLNDGFGHQVGDRLLRTAATRLLTVVADECALVARTGGDEFAILIENSPTTPEIPVLIDQIHEALAEPAYIDGSGLALNATIGVVRRPVRDTTGAELFRAADAALHCARATGRRQWLGYDSAQDARGRERHRAAAALPGAFENGELEVGYRPLVRLSDRQTVAVDAVLRWTGRADGPLDERETLELAELTGQAVLLGPWMLRTACESLPLWRITAGTPESAVLRVRLSRLQTADGDLVAAVLRAIESAGAPADRLEIAFDTEAVLAELGSAVDNLQVAAEIGVCVALCGWDGGPRQLDLLERSPARSVIMRDPFRGRQHLSPVVTSAVEATVSAARAIGARVSVDGVCHDSDAVRWAAIGVDTAAGPLFGEPTDLDEALTGNGHAAQ